MIPKRANSTRVSDLRPISLTSCGLRIIGTAVAARLLSTADELIGKDQRGFLQGRHIADNIVQFVAAVTAIEPRNCEAGAGIAIIDFEKAFDRVSHQYLSLLLEHVGMPRGMINLAMATLEGQTAQVSVNRTLGDRFPLCVGTRQGDPCSPFLFNLAIEPFLALLNRQLQGLKPSCPEGFGSFAGHSRLKYLAFADDLVAFVANEDDHHNLSRHISIFEAASNSKVSLSKSTIHYFNPLHTSPLNMSTTCDPPERYLGVPIQGVDWYGSVHKLGLDLHRMIAVQAPSFARAEAVNSYIYSKLYFRDIFDPMPIAPDEVEIEISAEEIRDLNYTPPNRLPTKSPYQVLMAYVQTLFRRDNLINIQRPLDYGGHGLLNMEWQLKGQRAKMIFHLFQPASFENWYYNDFRLRLQQALLTRAENGNCRTWSSFLLNPPRHVATHLPPDNEIRRLREEIEIHRYYNTPHLTKREKSWIRAWFELISSRGPCSIPTHHAVTLHAWNCPAAFVLPTQVGEHCTVFDPRLPEAVETACRDQLNNPVTLDSFHSTSRKHYRQHNDVFVPSTWFGAHYQSGAPPYVSQWWRRIWRKLKRHTRRFPHTMDEIWRFCRRDPHLFHPDHSFSTYADDPCNACHHPDSRECDDVHRFINCPVAQVASERHLGLELHTPEDILTLIAQSELPLEVGAFLKDLRRVRYQGLL